MDCPHCQSQTIVKNGKDYHQDGKAIQNYLCNGCGKRFNEGTETPANVVSLALKMRSEGMGIRASGRVLEKIPWKYQGMGAKIGTPVTACPEQIYQWREMRVILP